MPVKACQVLFGTEWDNKELQELYRNVDNVYFLKHRKVFHVKIPDLKSILQKIGVKTFPIVYNRKIKVQQIYEEPECSSEWRKYFETQREYSTREETVQIKYLGGIKIERLSRRQSVYIIKIVSNNWQNYYKDESKSEYSWFYYDQISKSVDACWWYDFKHKLYPPLRGKYWRSKRVPLYRCWLPDKETEQRLGEFLPVLDLSQFGDEQTQRRIANWLIQEVDVPTSLEDLEEDDWHEIISTHLPALISEELANQSDEARKKARRCYETFLEWAQKQKELRRSFDGCKLLCRFGDKYFYKANTGCIIYFDDMPKRTRHFQDRIYILELPSEYANSANKFLGVIPVSKEMRSEIIHDGSYEQLDGARMKRIQGMLPYIYAVRRHDAPKSAEETLKKLRSLEFYVVNHLRERLQLGDDIVEVDSKWALEERKKEAKIYVYLQQVNEQYIASAIAEALGVPSQEDFYENLLRIQNEAELRERLLEKGLNDADLRSALEKWYDDEGLKPEESVEEELEEELEESEESVFGDSSAPSTPFSREVVTPSDRDRSAVGSLGLTPPSDPEPKEEPKLRLVDPKTCKYRIRSGLRRDGNRDSTGDGVNFRYFPTTLMSDEQRRQVEQTGRQLVIRHLEEQGYEVIEMRDHNPGYDIRARKEGVEYHIEVKAHVGRASKVTLTIREYLEYAKQDSYQWQLWNVENLEEGKVPSITIYTNIPTDALEVKSFTVDLNRCLGD
ncbi:MAG: DUF3883 domain-containing protein, partial [Candidatus Caldarchaeum sp.]